MAGPATFRHEKLIAAVTLAPFLASFPVALVYVPFSAAACCSASFDWLNTASSVLLLGVVFGFISLVVTFSLGVLAHTALVRARVRGLLAYVAAGALIAAALVLLLNAGGAQSRPDMLLIALALGSLTACIAWLIRRPDNLWG